jgi:hypothetical protein
VSPDDEPFSTTVFVFTCARSRCQRAHLLRGEEIGRLFAAAAASGSKGVRLPDDPTPER